MKTNFFIFITITILFLASNLNSQFKGGSYDGYSSRLDTNIPYPVGIKNIEKVVGNYNLYQNYPNPFNPSTTISYTIGTSHSAISSFVKLRVYDALGKEVATLVNQEQSATDGAGRYEIEFDGTYLPSGIYFYQISIYSDKIQTENIFADTKKMILIK